MPAVLDLGYCLVGGVKPTNVLCRNDGYSAGTFCIMPKRQWPASNLRVKYTNKYHEPTALAQDQVQKEG